MLSGSRNETAESEMPKYRKKPVVIEAMQVEWYGDFATVAAWVKTNGGEMVYGQEDRGPARGYINTLEGTMQVNVSDYVIRGVKGEFYPCKPDIFAATYDPVETDRA